MTASPEYSNDFESAPHPTAEQEEGIRKHNAARKKLVDEVKKEWEEKQLKKLQPKKK